VLNGLALSNGKPNAWPELVISLEGPLKLRNLALLLTLIVTAIPAFAVPVVYTGYDIGSSSLAASPNATAAAAAFDAAAGALAVVDFESGLPAGFSMSAPNITSVSGCAPNLCGYNTTVAGSMFHLQTGGGQTISFTTPIDSFGAYFTGWQIGTQTITYTDNSQVVLQMGGADLPNGGTRFFGFIDAGASIASISYQAVNDIVAVDDVRYGKASQSVPEPSSLLLIGAGLVGLAGLLRRKQ
jgi:hypothetical protein